METARTRLAEAASGGLDRQNWQKAAMFGKGVMTKTEISHLLQQAGFQGGLKFEGQRSIRFHIDPRWPPPVWEAFSKIADAGWVVSWEPGTLTRQHSDHYGTKGNTR